MSLGSAKLSSVQHLSERARAPVYTQRKATPEEVAHDSEEDDSDQHSDENDFDQHSDDQQSDDEPDNADGSALHSFLCATRDSHRSEGSPQCDAAAGWKSSVRAWTFQPARPCVHGDGEGDFIPWGLYTR